MNKSLAKSARDRQDDTSPQVPSKTEPNSAAGAYGAKSLSKLSVPARIHLGTPDAQSTLVGNPVGAGAGKQSPSATKISAKGAGRDKKQKVISLSDTIRSEDEHRAELAEKVDKYAQILGNELQQLEDETTLKLRELEMLFKGAGGASMGTTTMEHIDLRLEKIAKRAENGKI